MWSLSLAIAVLAVATVAWLQPFSAGIHHWGATLAVALVALVLLVQAVRGFARRGQEGFAALGAIGGVVIAIAFIQAELLVGPPQRIGGAPGQMFRLPHSSQLALEYPAASADDVRSANPSPAVELVAAASRWPLVSGHEMRVRSYVLRAVDWPAAYVQARSQRGVAQTVTQPQSAAFVSPVLQFPNLDSEDDLPVDSFAVPALHRDVHVKFYPGLPSRGINIQFVQLQVDEENAGNAPPLFSGVAVSGRPVKAAGMELVFSIGRYPVVWLAGAPDEFISLLGAFLILAGLTGFVVATIRSSPQFGRRTA